MPTTYETDPERLARLRAELAPHWHDDHPQGPGPGRSPFLPDPEAPCTVCLSWRREVEHYREIEAAAESGRLPEAEAGAVLTAEAVDRWIDLDERLREHREVLHRPLRALPERPQLRAAYADPAPDVDDGRPVYREPRACAGVTERSKAFFLLNRHRLGRIVAAGMRDFEGTHPERGADGLRLYDDGGRVLALAGMTAGYGGEGCHGTLWVLRLCGFPEGPEDARGHTGLERLAFGHRAFWLVRRQGQGPQP
jgi:hypothetical protein